MEDRMEHDNYDLVLTDLQGGRKHLQQASQPVPSSNSCTVLSGSPGPIDMDLIHVSCNRKRDVSGILRISRRTDNATESTKLPSDPLQAQR